MKKRKMCFMAYPVGAKVWMIRETFPSLPCGFCGKEGVIFGKDGKKRICPKCNGKRYAIRPVVGIEECKIAGYSFARGYVGEKKILRYAVEVNNFKINSVSRVYESRDEAERILESASDLDKTKLCY